MFEQHREELIQAVIDKAKAGDTTALRICVDRLVAPVRSNPIRIGKLSGVRCPELVELTRQLLGKDYPLERIPCGISGKKFLDMVLKDVQGRCRSLPIIADDGCIVDAPNESSTV